MPMMMSSSMKSVGRLARPCRSAVLRSASAIQGPFETLWRPQKPRISGIQRSHRFSSNKVEFVKRFLSSTQVPLETEPEVSKPPTLSSTTDLPPIPKYLKDEYWWAYGHPQCIRWLDHEVLVDLVLWGNFSMLRDKCVEELCNTASSLIQGETLQIACVYANFTQTLVERLAPKSTLDIVDVIPAQLQNLKQKLSQTDRESDNDITLSCYDAQDLQYDDSSFDQVVLFFLLHEMPNEVRSRTLQEACRVLKSGGKLVMLDYHQPNSPQWQRVMSGMFRLYEPFAMDLWEHEIQDWLPDNNGAFSISKEIYCDGLFQKVVVTKN